MAGTVEHLAIALELIQRWNGGDAAGGEDGGDGKHVPGIRLQHPELFLAGNVCPDGIQARKNYQREMKKHTHFRDGIPDSEFSFPGNLELFHGRLRQFAEKNIQEGGEDRDLYLGYVTHILADELFMLTIRPEFMEKIATIGLSDGIAETFEHFTYDVNQIDFRLIREYPGMGDAYRMLKECGPYEIREMVTGEELTRSREWILDFFFEHTPEPGQPVFYTYGRALEFIREAVEFIEGRMYGNEVSYGKSWQEKEDK